MSSDIKNVVQMQQETRARRPRAQDVDRHIGARMRERRIMLGLTQQQLAELIGVTYQQSHKYEKGINRIAAGRLYHIAQALGVDVGYFYEGLTSGHTSSRTPRDRTLLEIGKTCREIRGADDLDQVHHLAKYVVKKQAS